MEVGGAERRCGGTSEVADLGLYARLRLASSKETVAAIWVRNEAAWHKTAVARRLMVEVVAETLQWSQRRRRDNDWGVLFWARRGGARSSWW